MKRKVVKLVQTLKELENVTNWLSVVCTSTQCSSCCMSNPMNKSCMYMKLLSVETDIKNYIVEENNNVNSRG